MPFPVYCNCGQGFMAQDFLAGKTVSCPACGAALQIPVVQPLQPTDTPVHGQRPPGRGSESRPSAVRSTMSQPAYPGSYGGYAHPEPRRSDEPGLTTGMKVAMGIAGGVVAIMVLAIVISSLISGDDTELADAPAPAETIERRPAEPDNRRPTDGLDPGSNPFVPSPVPRSDAPASSPSTTGPVQEPVGSPAGAGPFVPEGPKAAPVDVSAGPPPESASVPVTRSLGPLPAAVERWHASPLTLRGSRPVENEDFVVFHYSWMCELLPFLGHGKIYDQFNFQKPWMDDDNAEFCGELIPEFLNPADNRQKWTGSQFRGLALTHFVGMSGIEDGRNVVAATLPRTDSRAGVFGYSEVARAADITDGASQTVMLVGSGEIAAPWVQGGGATVRGARQPYFDPLTGFGSRGLAKPGTVVLMADGSTRHLSADMDPAVFRALCTIHGAESVDVSQLGPVAPSFPGTQAASGGRQPPGPPRGSMPGVRPW